jgi:GNAT superfamily N-acetyltransferase
MDSGPMTHTPGPRIVDARDQGAVRGFLGRLSPTTVRLRYLGTRAALLGPLADREVQRLLERDEQRHVVVVVADDANEIRGIGEFFIDESGRRAELALVVEDAFQGRGLGDLLYRRLEQLARELGIAQFTGDVAYGNQLVMELLRRTGQPLRLDYDYGVMRFGLALAA